ncbi:MAG: MBL fold metallo-hydrolase [Clostridia bacterium]|nr:MBL fold metallo-hydrolase [Clostridia bacterium]
MKLTLLGVYGPFPAPGKGCSSYLVEDGDTRILLDCGSGSLSRLRALIPDRMRLDAIVLSHLHADHCGEIDLFRYLMEFGLCDAPVTLFSPETERFTSPVFRPVRTSDGFEAKVGTMSLRFTEVRHAVKTTGVRITDGSGRSLFYTGDSAWFDGLADAARNADLLLADACLVDETNEKALQNHMTVGQVVRLKKAARCGRAVLTHRFGGETHLPALSDDDCIYAEEGAVFEI